METRCGGLYFTSKFDSGNLARVEKVAKDEEEDLAGTYLAGGEPRPDFEFNVWTRPDCGGTPFENGNRSWFYFGVKGASPGRLIKINIMNMNKQGKLYGQGFAPIVKTIPGKPKWERVRDKASFEVVDGQFILTFYHRFADSRGSMTYFAFCYPWSYAECQDRLSELDYKFEKCWSLSSKSPPDSIYYHRELMCYSQEKLRIDLITISSCHGITEDEEPRFDSKLFPDTQAKRCRKFTGKRVFVLTSRVHPGETPASHVFNGFLDFILRPDDPRACRLRKQYVFKLIPILNPDGVMLGHYRTDTRGVNLNRMYLDPDFRYYPSTYAAKALIVYHHVHYRVIKTLTPQPDEVKLPNDTVCENDGANSNNGRVTRSNSLPQTQFRNQRVQGPNQRYPSRNRTINIVHREIVDGKCVPTRMRNQGMIEKQELCSHERMDDVDNTPAVLSACSVDKMSEVISPGRVEERDMEDEELLPIFHSISLEQNLQFVQKIPEDVTQDMNCDKETEDVPIDEDPIFGFTHDRDPVLDEMTENLGNEGSDEEDDSFIPATDGIPKSPHLTDPKFLEIPPSESGVAFYVDLHGHASKRGCFIYGNYHENEENMIDCMLFPKLISINTAHFDFTGCNFSQKNMYTKDKRDGMSKEGSGRVAIYKATGLIHSYTLECNYNTGRMVNTVPPASSDDGRATPPPLAGFPPKYTAAHFEDVGKALAIAALDVTDTNPWSRVANCEHNHLMGVREWVRRFIRSWKGQKGRQMPRIPVVTNRQIGGTTGPSSSMAANGHARVNMSRFSSSSDTNSNGSSFMRTNTTSRRPPAPAPGRKELAPIKDPPPKVNPFQPTSSSTTQVRRRMTLPACNSNHSASISLANQRQSKTPPPQLPNSNPLENRQKVTASEFKLPIRLATATDFKTLASTTSEFKFTRPVLTNERTNLVQGLVLNPGVSEKTFTVINTRKTTSSSPPNDLGTLITEEEKVQQLKNLSAKRKPPKRLDGSKPIEAPKSDPPKRRTIKYTSRRRSSSHSPKSAKGVRDDAKTLMTTVEITGLKLSPRPTAVPEIIPPNPGSTSPIGRLRMSSSNDNMTK